MYKINNSTELANFIELTNLSNIATKKEIIEFLEKAKEYGFHSVVVNHSYVALAKEFLKDTNIKIVTVVGFPLGFQTTETKLNEASIALANGADEIDMVVNLNDVKDGKYQEIKNQVRTIKNLLGERTLKVIIETKVLEDIEKAKVSKAIEDAGADFIKTSTGFVTANTIYENVNDINIIQKYAPKTKIKVSGGINDYKIANQIITAGADRIGTSKGNEIIKRFNELKENSKTIPKLIKFD